MFIPTWGRFPFWLAHIFQMGWFNHQLDKNFSRIWESFWFAPPLIGFLRGGWLMFPKVNPYLPLNTPQKRPVPTNPYRQVAGRSPLGLGSIQTQQSFGVIREIVEGGRCVFFPDKNQWMTWWVTYFAWPFLPFSYLAKQAKRLKLFGMTNI